VVSGLVKSSNEVFPASGTGEELMLVDAFPFPEGDDDLINPIAGGDAGLSSEGDEDLNSSEKMVLNDKADKAGP
jgi:hypothetical protein